MELVDIKRNVNLLWGRKSFMEELQWWNTDCNLQMFHQWNPTLSLHGTFVVQQARCTKASAIHKVGKGSIVCNLTLAFLPEVT